MIKSAGYSLFEVLIAFVIMSMVLAALIPGQARLLGRATVQEERLLAHDYALSRLAQIGIIDDLRPGTSQDSYRDWQIGIAVVLGTAIASDVETTIVTVTVSDRQGRLLARVETARVIQ